MTDERSIAQQAGLPDNWHPIDTPPIVPAAPPSQVMLNSSDRYLTGSLPPTFQHDTSFTGTAYEGSRTPKLSLMPLGLQGNPSTNAGVQSTSKITVVNNNGGVSNPSLTGGQNISITGDITAQVVSFSGVLPETSGGTGTTTPGSVAGANITISGTWPNETFSAVAGGGSGGTTKKTANYLAASGDNGTLITFNGTSLTLTLPASPPSASWFIDVENTNATDLTIDPNGLDVDASASNLPLPFNQGVRIFTDGTNYFTQRGMGSGTLVSFTSASQASVNLSPVTAFTTSVDGFWVFTGSVTDSFEVDGSGAAPSLTVTIAGLTSASISFNGAGAPVTLGTIFGVTGTNTTPAMFLPSGTAVQVSSTISLTGGAALTYVVNIKAKML